jgi:hypothetical protein
MSNVYDTATGQYLLIPQGARLVGGYNSRVGYGQSGVQVAWQRVIFPDGSSIDLGGMAGLDAQGNAGLRDTVDHHYKQLFGFAVLTSMFDAALAVTQSRQQSILVAPNAAQETESAVGREVSQLGAQITRKNLNVLSPFNQLVSNCRRRTYFLKLWKCVSDCVSFALFFRVFPPPQCSRHGLHRIAKSSATRPLPFLFRGLQRGFQESVRT